MLTFQTKRPEALGVPSECIENMLRRLDAKEIPMHSLILLYRDFVIAEGYYAPYTHETNHRTFSITKSLTAIAIGLLQDEGKLGIDDPIIRYFPEYVSEDTHPWIKEMTIRNMLMMRTCHEATTYKLNMKSDWVESFFTVKPTHKPGTVFHYDTSSAHTLCALVEKLSGMELLDYLRKKLDILGLSKDSYALKDPFGVTIGGSGVVCTPQDLLKIGYFLLHEGEIEGQQLISREYIRQACSNQTATKVTGPLPSEACGYGYQIWQNEKGGFVLYGMGGQLVIVLPEYDFICVTTADTQGMAGGNQLIYDALYEEVLPFLVKTGEQLPIISNNPKSYDGLQSYISILAVKPFDQCKYPIDQDKICQIKDQINGKEYLLTENKAGFKKLRMTWDEKENHVLLTTEDGEYDLKFGFEKTVTDIFPKYEQKYTASGVWLDESTLYVRFHIIDEYVGSVHMQFFFGEDDVTVYSKKVEESLFTEFNCHLYGIYKE